MLIFGFPTTKSILISFDIIHFLLYFLGAILSDLILLQFYDVFMFDMGPGEPDVKFYQHNFNRFSQG